MTDSVDIFVGTDRSQLLAVAVLEHSILRHASLPCCVTPLIDLDLPEPRDIRQGSRTNFSFARFAIPELKGHAGRAIYLDADMLVFRDIAGLWNLPMDGATINIQEELPDEAVRHVKAGAPAQRKKQCAVMVIDCARAQWDVHTIVAGLDGQYSYEQLLGEMCILPEREVRYGVPFAWNSLEHQDNSTCLLHYTDMATQPWVSAQNRNARWWMLEVQLMLANGSLTPANLRREIDLGYFRPSLLAELDEMPHLHGWDAEAARRYEAIDKAAGYVKHAEVYRRKKARAEQVRLFEAELAQADRGRRAA
jgi:hypothetical protein